MVNFCKNCAVEVDEGILSCPLCDQHLLDSTDEGITTPSQFPDKVVIDKDKISEDWMFKAWELVSVFSLITFLILLTTDLIGSSSITWSRYPLLSITLFWLLVSIPLLLPEHLLAITFGEMLATLGFLVLLDYFHDWTITWFIDIALPIILITLVCISFVIVVGSKLKKKGLNLVGVILIGAGFLNVGLDVATAHQITWSRYVLTPVILVAGFLLYFHYRFMNNPNFRKRVSALIHI